MSIIGKDSFQGGETTRQRVSEVESAILARCSGYDPRGGFLSPEKLCSKVNTGAALTGATPEQAPFAFLDKDGATRIICRDSTSAMRELVSGAWVAASGTCPILTESVPVRMGPQIIFPTGGADPKLMAYEPEAPTAGTKLRPLSLKSPSDYAKNQPAITPSSTASSHTRMFDCDDANYWLIGAAFAAPVAGVSTGTYGTATTTTNKAVISLDSDAPTNTIVAKKSLAAATKDLTGKVFLVIDVMIANDPQAYSIDGLFVNDVGMRSSGYILELHTTTDCSGAPTVSFHIPKLTPQGKVCRIAFNLGTQTATIQGIALKTETFFTPPPSGTNYEISFYSEDFLNDWGHKGNFLLPAVLWDKSPWAAKLTALLSAGESQMVDLPASANLVTNPGFEDAALAFGENTTGGGWTLAGNATKKADGADGWPARSGGACIELDNWGAGTNERVYRTSGAYVPISAGRNYTVGCYFLNPGANQAQWKITVTYKNGIGGATVGSAVVFSGASGWYVDDKSEVYRLRSGTLTVPTGTGITHCDIQIEMNGGTEYADFRIDDVFLYGTNQAMQGSAVILQTFNTDGTERSPGNPKVRYAYCFGGKDLLGVGPDLWKLMVSNPSEWATDDSAAFADPWRTYVVAITLPSGPITAAAVNAGGTGYAVNDILLVANGTDGKVKVATLGAGGGGTAVATVTVLKAGMGYTDGATAVGTTNETDAGGTGCTLNLTASDATDEYGGYLLWFLIYRQLYDPETQTWYAEIEGKRYLSEWGYANYLGIGATATYTDAGVDAIASISDVAVPKFMELVNGYAASARHVMFAENRVYALGANWDNEDEQWDSPTAIQVSSYLKPWAFPATNTPKNDGSEGSWLDGYAVTGAEGRGIIHWRGEKYVFLDSEFFLLRGDNSQQGWRFVWVDSVGLKDARSMAGGRRALIWHDGHHFQASLGGAASSISRFLVDSSLIDWASPMGAVHFDEQYVFLCKLSTGSYVRMVYDLARLPEPGWRTRYSAALQVVGVCTDGQNVYGVTPTGDAVNIFGSLTTDYGAASVLREVWTQYLKASGPQADAHSGRVLFDIVTDQGAGIDMDLVMNWQGAMDGTQTIDLDPLAATTRYDLEMNGNGDAFQMRLSYTGTAAPDIYSMAFERDDTAAVL